MHIFKSSEKWQQAERTLRNRLLAWQRDMQGERPKAFRRTVGDLRRNAKAAEKLRLEQKKRERKKREIECRKECEAYLKKLSKGFPKVWKTVQHTIERGSGLAYGEAEIVEDAPKTPDTIRPCALEKHMN
jgi:hypothetical protein